MKKFYLLTSILALAACGGGSGGGGSNSNNPGNSASLTQNDINVIHAGTEVQSGLTQAAVESNENVTNMLSQIGVSTSNGSTINIGRSGSQRPTFEYNGQTYNSYDLSDVNFNLADEGLDEDGFKFVVDDNKKITHFYMTDETDFKVINGELYQSSDNGELVVNNGNLQQQGVIPGSSLTNNGNGTWTYTNPNNTSGNGTYTIDDEGNLFKLCGNDGCDLEYGNVDARLVYENGEVKLADDSVQVDEKTLSNYRQYQVDEDGNVIEIMKFIRINDNSDDFDALITAEGHTLRNAIMTYNSESRGNQIGLRYSDFGYFPMYQENEDTHQMEIVENYNIPFIGGYDVKQIDTQNISNNATFTGKAIGHVIALSSDGEDTNLDGILALNSDASLRFNPTTKTSVMQANFNNWYDVKYTKVGTNQGTVDFTNTNNKVIDNTYRLIGDNGEIANGRNGVTVSGEDLRYFGDNNIAREAVGLIQVDDCTGGNCEDDPAKEIRMNLGFGAK